MLTSEKNIPRLYTCLYVLVFSLLVVPWAYYIEERLDYSFLPRQIIFILIAVVAFILLYLQNKFTVLRVLIWLAFAILGVFHGQINGYYEPHYLYQFIYFEIAMLIIIAPPAIKEQMLKLSPYVLYILLLKAFYFRIGQYVHGGFQSSNLYATYIVYLSFVEVYKKRYWNLLPAACVLYFLGSKAAYMSMAILTLSAIILFLSDSGRFKNIFAHFKFVQRINIYWSIAVGAFTILVFTTIMVRTDSYMAWSKKMAPSKALTTANNMIMYRVGTSQKNEKQRGILLKTREMQFKETEVSITEKPMITDLGMSIGLRVVQYDYMHKSIAKYFFVGDTVGSQKEMFGNNPHSAVVDIISRLGLFYFILILLFYRDVFRFMDLLICNVCIIPILAFQPYGFTIGHSIVILSMVYVLSKTARDSRAIS